MLSIKRIGQRDYVLGLERGFLNIVKQNAVDLINRDFQFCYTILIYLETL